MKPLLTLLLSLCLIGLSVECFADSSTVAIQTIILEAQGESLEGQIAVGEVIRNRAFKAQGTFEQVVMAPKQFSCWESPGKAKLRLSLVSGQTWQIASKSFYESEHTNLTAGATHYYNPKLANPSWANKLIVTAKIGNHVFLKEKE